MISFAQNFEDVMLYRVFRDRPTGFYIDVGAADPVHHSVTKWFYDLGWSGINIEPRQAFFEALRRERTRDINLNCGAGAESGEAVFYELSHTNEWSSFDDAVRIAAAKREETLVERPIKICTLDEIIERHAPGRPIDFLKIDVEGWEQQVLRGLDLTRHRPTIFIVEATRQGTPEQNDAEWAPILTEADYHCVYFDGLNKFYTEGGRRGLARYFALPPNVIDDFTVYSPEAASLSTQLASLSTQLKESEADRAARLEVIRELEARFDKLLTSPIARFWVKRVLRAHESRTQSSARPPRLR